MDVRQFLTILLFSMLSGAAFGIISGGIMAGSLPHGPAMFVGGIFGGLLGLLAAPMFMIANRGDRLFAHLAICFVFAFPVVVLSALSFLVPIAVALDLLVIVATFHVLGKSKPERPLRKRDFLLPMIVLILAAGVAYISDDLPDDAPSLIEVLGDNDISRHVAAGNRLSRNFGQEPLISALHHRDARVRSRAAHFLAWFPNPLVLAQLTKASNDADDHVRMWVAFSLGEHGDTKALETLLKLSGDPAEIVRRRAQESISKIQSKK